MPHETSRKEKLMRRNVKVKVYDDGDTELSYTKHKPPFTDDNEMLVVFSSEEVLRRELRSYGHEDDSITEALQRLNDGEEDVII